MRLPGFALLAAVLTAVAGSEPTLPERLDHSDLAVPRLRALCAERAPGGFRTLLKQQHAWLDSAKAPGARQDPRIWSALGCIQSMLYVDSPLVKVGGNFYRSSFAMAALLAFQRVSKAIPADSVAAIGLATLAFDYSESEDGNDLLPATEPLSEAAYHAVRGGVRAPIVLRMCTDYAIAAADFATARYCISRAIMSGADSSWQLERQAYLAFLFGNSLAGTGWFEAATALAHDSATLSDLAWHASWLIDTIQIPAPSILARWQTLSDSSRVAWVRAQVANGAANSADGSPYLRRLEQAFLTPGFQSPILAKCPVVVARNGSEQPADQSHCLSAALMEKKRLTISGQLIRVWDPASGAPVGIIGFAVQRKNIAADSGRYDTRTATVAINVRQYEWESARWRDTTLNTALSFPHDDRDPPLAGLLRLPIFRGTMTWSLSGRQPSTYGAISLEGTLALAASGYALSDLVLGVTEQGVSFTLGDDTVALAPLATVRRSRPLELYYQLRSDSTTNELHTDIVLHRIVGGDIAEESELRIATSTPAHAGINVVHRELNIAALASGDHQLEVRVLNSRGQLVAERTVNLLVR